MTSPGALGLNTSDHPGEIRGETELAFKFYDQFAQVEVWLPKSIVTWRRGEGRKGVMTMPLSTAAKRGLT